MANRGRVVIDVVSSRHSVPRQHGVSQGVVLATRLRRRTTCRARPAGAAGASRRTRSDGRPRGSRTRPARGTRTLGRSCAAGRTARRSSRPRAAGCTSVPSRWSAAVADWLSQWISSGDRVVAVAGGRREAATLLSSVKVKRSVCDCGSTTHRSATSAAWRRRQHRTRQRSPRACSASEARAAPRKRKRVVKIRHASRSNASTSISSARACG